MSQPAPYPLLDRQVLFDHPVARITLDTISYH